MRFLHVVLLKGIAAHHLVLLWRAAANVSIFRACALGFPLSFGWGCAFSADDFSLSFQVTEWKEHLFALDKRELVGKAAKVGHCMKGLRDGSYFQLFA